MRGQSLLVFGIVFNFFYLVLLDQRTCWAALSPPLGNSSPQKVSPTGFCYEVYAGTQNIGFILGTQSLKTPLPRKLPQELPQELPKELPPKLPPKLLSLQNPTSESSLENPLSSSLKPSSVKKQFTHLVLGNFDIIELQRSESDSLFNPVYSEYSRYENGRLKIELRSNFKWEFKAPHKITAQIYKKSPQKTLNFYAEFEPGLVLASYMTDLLFYKKKGTELKPHQKFIFKTFDEASADISEIQTVLETQSEQIQLNHRHQGKSYTTTYTTTHTTNGHMIQSFFPNQNIHYKTCKNPDQSLHVAVRNKKFKTLFSLPDQEKIRLCCLHF